MYRIKNKENDSMRSILVLAPHPDDEALACAGIIKAAVLNRDIVNVVVVTNGDYLGKDIAQIRYYESLTALKTLGLTEKNIIWLGFADTGMDIDKSFLNRLFYSKGHNITSPFSNCTYHPVKHMSEFAKQIWNKHLPYNRESLLKCLDTIINITNPNDIYLPSSLDLHGDHKALNLFMNELSKKNSKFNNIRMFEYIVHGGDDKYWPQRQSFSYNQPPIVSDKLWSTRSSIKIPNGMNKLDVLQIYKSQISSSGYVESFSKYEEIFWIKKGI